MTTTCGKKIMLHKANSSCSSMSTRRGKLFSCACKFSKKYRLLKEVPSFERRTIIRAWNVNLAENLIFSTIFHSCHVMRGQSGIIKGRLEWRGHTEQELTCVYAIYQVSCSLLHAINVPMVMYDHKKPQRHHVISLEVTKDIIRDNLECRAHTEHGLAPTICQPHM